MSTAQEATIQNVRERVSTEEWQMLVDLAAAYRLLALFGWDDLIFTHLSARVPGPENHFLINPFGMLFEEVTASSLVKLNLDGQIVMEGPYGINPAGFTIHSAVHAAREDVQCVLHTHTRAGIAVSAQKAGVLPEHTDAFVARCREVHRLTIDGLMCIPPAEESPGPHFALLAKIARRNGLRSLSMGMSGDFETAIAFGATDVRVGSAIFGERPAAA